jgi:hypothetical protein
MRQRITARKPKVRHVMLSRPQVILTSPDGTSRPKSGEFEELFGRVVESFYHETSAASTAMWSVRIADLSSSGPFNKSPTRQAELI